MASCRSTITASVATEAGNGLRSGQFQLLAWFSPAETPKGLGLLLKSEAPFQRPYHYHRNDYVAGVNYLDRPATTILAGWKRGMISL